MQKRSKILLVDDKPDNLSALEGLLRGLNAEIVCAISGEQVVSFLQNGGYCAAVVSADMPEMAGCALLAKMRAQPAAADLPIILLYPGYPDEAEFYQGYAAGAADILTRSLSPAVLTGKLGIYIAHARTGAAGQIGAPSALEEQTVQGEPRKEALFDWLSRSIEQIARALSTSLDVLEVPNLILEQLPQVVPYERGSILLRDGNILRMVAIRGFPPGWPANTRIPLRENDVFQQIVESRQALLIDDVTTTSAWQQMEGLPLNRSWLGVPLVSKDRVIGMVSLTRQEAAAFQPEEISLIRASASQATVALINAGLLSDLERLNEQLEQLVQERTDELARAYARLEKIDQTKTSFISIAAHELRTPLTLINGYTSLLGNVFKENKDAGPLVDGILTGERRLLDVVNSMIDVSKIDTQALLVCKSATNVSLIIKLIHSEYKPALKERQIVFTVLDMEQLPDIQADPQLLEKMFRQLISNAIKYTPDGGAITVEGNFIPGKVSGKEPGDSIEILVRDTGIGIDPAYQEVIFDKFYQMGSVELHSSGKTRFKGGGPGLGLSIARGIVQAHAGRIWVDSPGHDEKTFPGSCFHVLLPV